MATNTTETIDLAPDHEASDEEVRQLQGEDTQAGAEVLDGHDDDVDEEAESTVRRDSEIESAATDEEREQIRERRRNERRNKSKRQRDKIEQQQREISSLKATVGDLAQRVGGMQDSTFAQSMQNLDAEIARADQAAKHFRGVAADAVAKQNGVVWADAQEKAEFASRRLQELNGLKTQITQGVERQQRQPQPVDPRVMSHAQKFRERHNWYTGPQGKDPDTRVLTALDSAVNDEGFDPRSPEYWQELEARIGKYLPHRSQREDDGPNGGQSGGTKPLKQPVAGAGSGNPGSGKGATYQVSAARVQAIKEAGNWNDPAKRAKAIKSYQEYDKRNPTR